MAGFFQAELILSVLLTLYSLQDVCAVISVGETEIVPGLHWLIFFCLQRDSYLVLVGYPLHTLKVVSDHKLRSGGVF